MKLYTHLLLISFLILSFLICSNTRAAEPLPPPPSQPAPTNSDSTDKPAPTDSDSTDKPAPTDSDSTDEPAPTDSDSTDEPAKDPRLLLANIGKISANELATIEPEAFVYLQPKEIKKIPPEAFAGLTPEQLSNMIKIAVGAITVTQFEYIPTDTLGGLTSDNMGGLSTEVIGNLVLTQLNALDVNAFKQMPGKDVNKLLNHFDAEKISPSDVQELLPNKWRVNINTGALMVPVGTELTFKSLPMTSSAKLKLPTVPNLNAGFGVGGGGTPLIDDTLNSLNTSLKTLNVKENFELSQNEQGILSVKGVNQFEGVKHAFMPDSNNAIQVDTDKIPLGLSTGAGGFSLVTTPEGLQYRVIPAPQDPSSLSESLGGGEVVVGEQGDVMMKLSPNAQSDNTVQVVIMESLVESAIDDSCVEVNTGIVSCDGVRKVVYSDGSAQAFHPTFLSPDIFIETALKIDGIKRIIYKTDGSFYVFFQGNSFLVRPNYDVKIETRESDETITASITSNNKGGLTFTVPIINDDETTLRNGSEDEDSGSQQYMVSDSDVEEEDEETCVEYDDGEVVCEYDDAEEYDDSEDY